MRRVLCLLRLDKMSPGPPIPLEMASRGVAITGHWKNRWRSSWRCPFWLSPKVESLYLMKALSILALDMLPNPSLSTKADDSHTVKQKLAPRLSEKKDKILSHLWTFWSPHSKGSTDSGYFSRSESAEQQISPPNTNAKSYEEIIFGKYCRLSSRNTLSVTTTSQERATMGRKGTMDSLPHVNTRLDVKMFEDPVSQLIPSKAEIDPSQTGMLKIHQIQQWVKTIPDDSIIYQEWRKTLSSQFPRWQPSSRPSWLLHPLFKQLNANFFSN